MARIAITAQIIDSASGAVLARRRFSRSAPAVSYNARCPCGVSAWRSARCSTMSRRESMLKYRRGRGSGLHPAHTIVSSVLRKRASDKVNKTLPITARAANCGQTTERPAPRYKIAWASMMKWVFGAASMMN